MLNFVLGTSGVGKTKYLYDKFCNLAKNGEDKLVFIVPDQSSFSAEKAFLKMLGPKLSRNIKVFGFSRLCDYVFEQTGNRFMSFADEGIRNVVMNVAVEQCIDKLELFSKRATATDLTELMLNAIKEYKKCSISSQMLYNASENVADETLSKKLYETALLYDAYDAIMSKSYIDPLDSLTHICKVIENTNLFDGYTIAVDSYYGFTSQEYEVLSQLIIQSEDFYVALTTDNADAKNTDLFFVTDRTKKNLVRIAKSNGVSVAKPVMLFDNKRFVSQELTAVDSNIFRILKEKSEYTGDNLKVYQANSIYDEVSFVARNIRKLLIEDGYRYSDIAVITRQSDAYCGIIDTEFDKYNINYFMDKPQDIDTKPLIRFVMSCFDVISSGFDKEDVLALLKTDLTDITVEQIADFENYIYTWDITGKKFFEEFTMNPRGFADEFKESDRKLLDEIESTRKTLINALRTFYYETKDTTVLEISKALMKLIGILHCKENILAMCNCLEKDGEIELSNEQVRLYNIFVEILDKMVLVIGDYRISAKRFSQLLHINFQNTDISFIPRGIDQVDVACADRSLLEDKKAVFVIGCIDSQFPHTPVESSVFSDDERSILHNCGITLSDSVLELIPTEKYLAYKALTSASEKLYISYYAFSLNGSKCLPSVIISEMPEIFDDIKLDSSVDKTIFDELWSEKSAFDYYVSNYNSDDPDIRKLGQYFSQKDEYKSTISAVSNMLKKDPKRITSEILAKKIFNPDMTLSASQVENFHLCKFEYFVKYGLRINERRQAKMDSLEYGTLMHYLLEEFFKKHKDDDFTAITAEEITQDISAFMDEYAQNHLGGKDNKSSRFMYLYYRMKRTAVRIVQRLVEEFAQSKFRPSDFELSIGEDVPAYNLVVNDEITVKIRGSIDRVDVMEQNGKKYIRVVDYKTGTKKYSLSDVLYGINLQMLIYMSAVKSGARNYFGDDVVPAGVLYTPAVSPYINITSISDMAKAISKASRDCRMHGIVLDDAEVIKGMEQNAKGVYIPVSIKGDTIVDSSGSLATLEEFGSLFAQVDCVVSKMAISLCSGDVSAIPAKGEYDACKWCPYISVCGYRENDDCLQIKKYDKESVYDILNRGEEQHGEERMD